MATVVGILLGHLLPWRWLITRYCSIPAKGSYCHVPARGSGLPIATKREIQAQSAQEMYAFVQRFPRSWQAQRLRQQLLQLYLRQGQTARALHCYQEWSHAGHDARANFWLSLAMAAGYLARQQGGQAREVLVAWWRRYKSRYADLAPLLLLHLAHTDLQTARYERAAHQLERLLQLYPLAPECPTARRYLSQARYYLGAELSAAEIRLLLPFWLRQHALSVLRTQVQQSADPNLMATALQQLYQQKHYNCYLKLAAYFLAHFSQHPAKWRVQWQQARIWSRRPQQRARAVALLQQLLQADAPSVWHLRFLLTLGDSLVALGRNHEAREYYLQAAQQGRSPRQISLAYYCAAWTAYREKNWSLTERLFTKASQGHGYFQALALRDLARVYHQQHNWGAARQVLQRLLARDDAAHVKDQACLLKARVHIALQEYADARTCLTFLRRQSGNPRIVAQATSLLRSLLPSQRH